jgi:hypothetical protein
MSLHSDTLRFLLKEHKAYESLKEWGSIRVLIFLCLSNLSKSKIPNCFGVLFVCGVN